MLAALRTRLIDTIYPPRCIACPNETDLPDGLCASCWRETTFITGPTCGTCGSPVMETGLSCESCQRHPPAWDTGCTAILYGGVGRRVILGLKHNDRLDTAPVLAGWLMRAGRSLVEDADILAPVPQHWTRTLKRNYNQAAELTRALAAKAGRDWTPDLLTRTRATKPFQNLKREERLAELEGALRVPPRHLSTIKGARITLVDDILTTGTTLSSMAELLRDSGAAEVNVLAVARVAREDVHTI
ncbi:MAG: ComF family protein [Pseudomonadota bacterium]